MPYDKKEFDVRSSKDVTKLLGITRGPCTFRQRDITRALRATVAAGIEVQRIEIEKDGKIVVVAGKQSDSPRDGGDQHNEWDSVHGQHSPSIRS